MVRISLVCAILLLSFLGCMIKGQKDRNIASVEDSNLEVIAASLKEPVEENIGQKPITYRNGFLLYNKGVSTSSASVEDCRQISIALATMNATLKGYIPQFIPEKSHRMVDILSDGTVKFASIVSKEQVASVMLYNSTEDAKSARGGIFDSTWSLLSDPENGSCNLISPPSEEPEFFSTQKLQKLNRNMYEKQFAHKIQSNVDFDKIKKKFKQTNNSDQTAAIKIAKKTVKKFFRNSCMVHTLNEAIILSMEKYKSQFNVYPVLNVDFQSSDLKGTHGWSSKSLKGNWQMRMVSRYGQGLLVENIKFDVKNTKGKSCTGTVSL